MDITHKGGAVSKQVEDIFYEVADLHPDARARYFAQRHVHESLRIEVEALIAFDSESSRHLTDAVARVADRAVSQFTLVNSRCGP